MSEYATPEEEWRALLEGTHPHLSEKSPLRFIPSNPRCKLCKAPFGNPGASILRRYGYGPWPKNPRICARCFISMHGHVSTCPVGGADEDVHGAEVDLSMLFADVRGSSALARQMSAHEFSRLMDRFYRVSSEVLIDHDAVIEKFVGDEVVGLFIPFLAGREHTTRAVDAARALLRAAGYGTADGPWVPIGAAVHTGRAFVGMVGTNDAPDFTALGDAMNIAAHLSAQAAGGEILITEAVAERTPVAAARLERRHVSLKGYPIDAFVLPTEPVGTSAA